MSDLRKTTQYLLPLEKESVKGYDIYPVFDLGDGRIFSDYVSLAREMLRYRNVTTWARVQGSSGLNVALPVPVVMPSDTAQRTAAACHDRFFEPFTAADGTSFRIICKGNVWFTAVMVRGLAELYAVDGNAACLDDVQRSLDYAWEHARDERGLFETDFTGVGKDSEKWLLTQAAMAEMYGRMSRISLDGE